METKSKAAPQPQAKSWKSCQFRREVVLEKQVSKASRYLERKGCLWLWINFFHKQRALRKEPLSQEQQVKGSGIRGTLL